MAAAAAWAVGLSAAACVDSAPASPGSEVRDSAGVTIVTNQTPAVDAPPLWTLEPEPAVAIGVLDGAEPYLLSGVRKAVRLEDGRIVVANQGTMELRFYDADGSHLGSVGGEGEGPGEFLTMSQMVRMPGDSLGVWDYRSRRLTVLDPEGGLGRTARMEEAEDVRIPFLQGVLPDGSLLASAAFVFEPGESRNGLMRQPARYVRYGPDGAALGPLVTLPGSESLVESGEGFVRVGTAPLSRHAFVHETARGFVGGASDRYELGFYDLDGTLLRLLRLDRPVRPVDDAVRAAYEEEQLAGAADAEARASVRERLEGLVYPPSLPAFSDLEVDALGNVWVQDHRPPGEDGGPDRWLVFDPEGRILGAVELPAGFTVFEIGEDYVLGRLTDDLEVERVLLHVLRREP